MLAGALCTALAGAASGSPLQLTNPQPRWVLVRFEISPPPHPGRTDAVYSRPFAAWFEPSEAPGVMTVRVAGRVVEQHLLRGQQAVSGSFSDFIWHFDSASGHVLEATVDGRLVRELGWGIAVEAPMRVRMGTLEDAGFEAPRSLLGNQYHAYCRVAADDGCTRVLPRAYQPETGYVNAVGDIVVSSGPLRVHSFSPLGEARFLELPLGPVPSWDEAGLGTAQVSAPPPGD